MSTDVTFLAFFQEFAQPAFSSSTFSSHQLYFSQQRSLFTAASVSYAPFRMRKRFRKFPLARPDPSEERVCPRKLRIEFKRFSSIACHGVEPFRVEKVLLQFNTIR